MFYISLRIGITNTEQLAHQFVMIPMGMGMEHMSVDEMHQAAFYIYDSVAPPGETRMFDFTLASSVAGQNLAFLCGTHGHYAVGMQLPFMVHPHQ